MTQQQTVSIAEAKGRPMLHWVGKRPLDYVTAFPAQLVEIFNPTSEQTDAQGLLFHGDNKDVLAWLLAHGYRGKVNLVYIDPPFNTGVDYVRKVRPRGIRMEKLEGEGYSFTEQIQYANNWHIDAYLQFLYEKLLLAKETLADDGVIFVRMDVHFGYYLRAIADEVFGRDHFQNEIVVNRIRKNVTKKGRRNIPNAVDYLYVYFKGPEAEYKYVLRELPETRPGYWHNMDSPGIPGPRELVLDGKTYYPSPGVHLKFPQVQAEEMWRKGLIRENPKTGALEYWVEEKDHENLVSDWTDIPGYSFKTGYPTENSEQLLERVILAGSRAGDLVMDFFVGSGTTAAVAQKLGRRWIAADINKGAIQTTSKRLQTIICEQIEAGTTPQQVAFQTSEVFETSEVSPAALSFSVYRVNDYDLQIQHNEAVNLAVELIGIERTKMDAFFDGTLGRRLVKITPFNHPLTLLDLQLLQDELKARPDEERDVVVICLGKETVVDPWLEEYNKHRPVNKIEVIELRTDQKYGKFFVHQPAQAQVHIQRQDGNITVEIEDFISPTIAERLEIDTPLFKAQIPDWRAMVDVVLIDTAYDGDVFDINLSDVPQKKNDLVNGHYELAAPDGSTTVAIKIIDMLGEEVLITAEV